MVRHVVQQGYGADVVFAAGTTGEWDRVSNDVCQQVIRVCAEEIAKLNATLGGHLGPGVECWAGVTAHSAAETLENLEFAIACGVDAAVLAPLSIRGVDDPVRFVQRDVADLLDVMGFAGRHPRVRLVDVMELCPPHDEGGKTARLAALGIWHFLAGLARRRP